MCSFNTSYKKKKDYIITINKEEQDKTINLLEFIKNKYFLYIFSLKNQYNYFNNGKILNKTEYNNQINDINHVFNKLNILVSNLLDNVYLKKDIKYIIIKKIIKNSKKYFNYLDKDTTNEYIKIYNFLIENLD